MDDFKVVDDFKVESEKKKRPLLKYSVYTLFAALGLIGATGCDLFVGYPTMGTVTTQTMTTVGLLKDTVAVIADSMIWDSIEIVMNHDILLTLQTNDQVIFFEADGYDASNKIAYEYISSYYYYGNENYNMNCDEIGSISNYCFGDYYILILTGYDESGITNEVGTFIDFYTNR